MPSNVTFNVTIDGKVGHNTLTTIHVTGKLYVSDPIPTLNTLNGDNPRDVVLFCGNPILSPSAGSIWLSSNQKLYETVNLASLGSLLPLDCCFLDIDDLLGSLDVQLDSTQALSVLLNGFNVSSTLGATVYRPKTGTLSLIFSADGQSVSGSIDIAAVDILNRSFVYQATITGTLAP